MKISQLNVCLENDNDIKHIIRCVCDVEQDCSGDTFPMSEDIDSMEALTEELKGYIGREITAEKLCDIIGNYDVWVPGDKREKMFIGLAIWRSPQ